MHAPSFSQEPLEGFLEKQVYICESNIIFWRSVSKFKHHIGTIKEIRPIALRVNRHVRPLSIYKLLCKSLIMKK